MKYSTNKVNYIFSFVVFLLFCFGNTFLFSLIHKHGEVNLHFHAENLLTKDHTVAVDTDCFLCEAILNSVIYTFEPAKNAIFIIAGYAHTPTNKFYFFYLKYFTNYSGRAPPILKS